MSAFGDDSMLQQQPETPLVPQFNAEEDYDGEGGHKTRFKEEDERFDLLKDIRAQQDQ